jgi:two-component system nitrogen regulation sensor histidine kinase NtrY
VQDAVLLQEGAQQEGVQVSAELSESEVWSDVDATMISQALTNLIKNAGEAIETYREKSGDAKYPGEVRVAMSTIGDTALITISDNGVGLPADRAKLFEPYVTTREKGTGLGLSIVKKIIEEHGGTLVLTDAEAFTEGARHGARAEIRLPLAPARTQHTADKLAV